MKKLCVFLVATLFIMTGCGGEKQIVSNDLIVVDVTKSYSSKKELILQDFMDVEYIALETTEEYVNQGFVQDIGKDFILVKNSNQDGDIFVYDRTGKALRKINRRGEGNEEYTNIYNITLDEDNREIFVNDIFKKKFYVYDLYGNYKRSLIHKEGSGTLFYTDVFNYDKDNLICYDSYNEEIAFVLVSKMDGSITKEINVPFTEKKQLRAVKKEGKMTYSISPGPHRPIIPYKGNWLLLEFSSDTVYSLLPDNSLRPFMVRTPPVQSMNPETMFILRLMSDNYYFMEAVENKYSFDTNDGFSTTYFMYDNKEETFSGYTVYNGDFLTKKEVDMSELRPVSHEIDSWDSFEAHRLVELLEKGQLKDGPLKEIAAKLDEDDNQVIMLVKHKK